MFNRLLIFANTLFVKKLIVLLSQQISKTEFPICMRLIERVNSIYSDRVIILKEAVLYKSLNNFISKDGPVL